MVYSNACYTTKGGIFVSLSVTNISSSLDMAIEEILVRLDSQRGGLLASSYEYPGRYKRWAIGFVNPPLELATCNNTFTITALNERGKVLLNYLADHLLHQPDLEALNKENNRIVGSVKQTERLFSEEERSKQPSVFTVVREILSAFSSPEDEHLGLYGAFGYDLVFQFEQMPKLLERSSEQRDLVLYLPDELLVVDNHLQQAFRLQYDFVTRNGSTRDLPRTGEIIDYRGKRFNVTKSSDHAPGEYEQQVNTALDYFRRGDLFEVVPSQSFFQVCENSPTELFRTLKEINPSPYGFIFNLGGEYLIGASPEMFVRVEGRRVETCPISGTIRRGLTAIDDAMQIQKLLNSRKDESELTMCTDVDRNDKSRICEPGSVRVIGRRQIELYSHLIHTVDHVEGLMRAEFDALDAFLSHLWAVTVTGAPKRSAMQFLEQHEHSPRRWYGGAVGYLSFKGNLNTGLILRTIQLKDSVAEVRVGATVLYDSEPEAEAQETITKASALFKTLDRVNHKSASLPDILTLDIEETNPASGKRVLLVDYEDSFVHTLANYIRQTGATVITLRHGFTESVFDTEKPDLVILSPGPGKPSDFKITDTIAACLKRRIPIVGVCLGLQGIVESYGGQLGVLNYPQHGKVSRVRVVEPDSVSFKDLPQSFEVGRYHSLYALQDSLPKELKVTAISEDGVVMGIEHKTLPIAAFQFHPESIMTLAEGVGLAIVKNVVTAFTSKPSLVQQF
ncbi:anthranilate synthase [Aetokthonos hydrillicola Thurmond2011]|jgi:anthranilate synthase|uniref:Anthranilate synthase n=1 Tax=Aetokthonos hydrillicola Thurmond2011 TaxID=2712845 RepID=A0AAP5MB52_9CYAN|nr:anthranilate synthase [Aetokthonos hydrillicola]MBO3458238.1 anthranilate synthase [Aetokthonos hydrillicola CCALA 1050]MBW4584457.1 anthranilate synthase [Aetokthonos hydrillicola CCALA 1050]MDR9896419.1 anthranilate synthase [Aetokthonos hydrillicola Thurmond2011]